MINELPKATHQGILKFGKTELNCAVLTNDKRVLTTSGVFKAFDRPSRGNARLINVPVFIDAQNLQPFVDKGLTELIKQIDFIDLNGKIQKGYDAMIIPALCELYFKAEDAKAIKKSQDKLLKQSRLLTRFLANEGIYSLVNKATGFIERVEQHAVQIEPWLASELRPWKFMFDVSFYKQIYKLMSWDWSLFERGIWKNHPQYTGKITNQIVYEKLPFGVLAELKKKAQAKNVRLHQALSENIGARELSKMITATTTIMSLYPAGNFKEAKAKIDSMFPSERECSQMSLDFPISKNLLEPKLSNFNKKLKKGLEFDPKENL